MRAKAEVERIGIAHDIAGRIGDRVVRRFGALAGQGSTGCDLCGWCRGFRLDSRPQPCGVALVDAGGVSRIYSRALPLQKAGYRVATLRDDDAKPDAAQEAEFEGRGVIFMWREGKAIEDEIFACALDNAVGELLDYAIALHGEELVASHVASVSGNAVSLHDIQVAALMDGYSAAHRDVLAKASSTKKNPWFKTVTAMEKVGREIIGPEFRNFEKVFKEPVAAIFSWATNAE